MIEDSTQALVDTIQETKQDLTDTIKAAFYSYRNNRQQTYCIQKL